jgi:hypothetical protein
MFRSVRRVTGSALLVAAMMLFVSRAAVAAPILNPGNGHWYDFITGSFTWAQALAAAAGQTFDPPGPTPLLTGYLVTITDAAEQAFLNVNYPSALYWIAGTDQAVEGDWRWAAGPELGQLFWQGGPGGTAFGFANWNAGEPNDVGNEDFAGENHFGANWNDFQGSVVASYVVEFSAAPTVPEPVTLVLLASGLGAMAVNTRRRRRTPRA